MMKIVVGEGSCGIAAGAEKVRQALLKEDLNGAMLTIAGCIGMCYLEPIVDIYEDGKEVKRLVRVTENDAKKIAEYAKTGDENAIAPLLVSDEDKEFLNKQISKYLDECIKERKEVIEEDIKKLSITEEKSLLCSYMICPISANGDIIGLVILTSETKIKDSERNIAIIASQFLGKNIEE